MDIRRCRGVKVFADNETEAANSYLIPERIGQIKYMIRFDTTTLVFGYRARE